VLETEHHRIVGDLHLPREGYLSRFSDFIDRHELRFITLTDAIVTERNPAGAGEGSAREFIAVGSDHIQFAYPDSDGRA